MDLVYLHGFASSPDSSKATFLSARLAEIGITLHCPDLNKPDFSTMTVSRMINDVERVIADLAPSPIALIGSSLGAFVALHLAERCYRAGEGRKVSHSIEHLVLLAPAFDFRTGLEKQLGADGLNEWRATDRLAVQNYAEGRTCDVHYDLYADAGYYDSFAATVSVPMLILQGRGDEVVDPRMVASFARGRDHVKCVLLDDDHQLKNSLDRVWNEISVFLGLDQ